MYAKCIRVIVGIRVGTLQQTSSASLHFIKQIYVNLNMFVF